MAARQFLAIVPKKRGKSFRIPRSKGGRETLRERESLSEGCDCVCRREKEGSRRDFSLS